MFVISRKNFMLMIKCKDLIKKKELIYWVRPFKNESLLMTKGLREEF